MADEGIIRIRLTRRLALDYPDAARALDRMAELAMYMLEKRINQQGLDASGRPLPEVSERGRFWWHVADPRTGQLDTSALQPRNEAGSTGRPRLLVNNKGYRSFKRQVGKRSHRGSSLTGALWKSIRASAKKVGSDGWEFKIFFGGSVRVVGGGRLRNRDKARLLQYGKRKSGQGYQPEGVPDFSLMTFTTDELLKLRALWRDEVRHFRQV